MEEDFHRRSYSDYNKTGLSSLNDSSIELTAFDSEEKVELLIDSSSPASPGSTKRIEADGHGAAPPGSANAVQVVINIIISFVGAGLLGQPHAFMKSGWLLGSCALLSVSALNLYAMLRLPAVKSALEQSHPNEQLNSYGDIGRCVLGRKGEILVQVCLAISQAGFGTAYIIFIAANAYSIAQWPRFGVCIGVLPGLIALVQFRGLKSLSPFSLLANTANFAALCSVLFQDYESYQPHNDTIHAVKWEGLLYVCAVTMYSLEGVGLILSLQKSCKHPAKFPRQLTATLTIISVFMALFGSAGYMAFGDRTQAPITLNLTNSIFVKIALCLGLYLTFPIMMFPIWNILEGFNPERFREHTATRVLSRATVVMMSVLVAYLFPHFGKFLSLVGSSICTLLGFILPCFFHLAVLGKQLAWYQYALDVTLLVSGIAFGIVGTYQSIAAAIAGEDVD